MNHLFSLLHQPILEVWISERPQRLGRVFAWPLLRTLAGILAAFWALGSAPCVAQATYAQGVGKVNVGLSGPIDRVLWVSDKEVLFIRSRRNHSIYAAVGNALHHSEHNAKELNKQLTETSSDSFLWALFLSPDGRRIIWSLSYTDSSEIYTCGLDGTEQRDWDKSPNWKQSKILGWLGNSQQWVQGVSRKDGPYTHLLIQDVHKNNPETAIPIEVSGQPEFSDNIWFTEPETMVVGKRSHGANGTDSMELIQLHIGTTVTVQSRYTATVPLGDKLCDIALSRNGRKIAVLVERRNPEEIRKSSPSKNKKSDPFQYVLLMKDIDAAEFHVLVPSLQTSYYEVGVPRPVLWGLSWSPDGDKLGYCVDDRVFVLRVEGTNVRKP